MKTRNRHHRLRRLLMGAVLCVLPVVIFLVWLGVRWWWRDPTAQVFMGDRLDIHAAVYKGTGGDRLIYIPATRKDAPSIGVCYVVLKSDPDVTWSSGAPPYLIGYLPTFVVMAALALEKPDPNLYPVEKFESERPFRRLNDGVDFDDIDGAHVRVYW